MYILSCTFLQIVYNMNKKCNIFEYLLKGNMYDILTVYANQFLLDDSYFYLIV